MSRFNPFIGQKLVEIKQDRLDYCGDPKKVNYLIFESGNSIPVLTPLTVNFNFSNYVGLRLLEVRDEGTIRTYHFDGGRWFKFEDYKDYNDDDCEAAWSAWLALTPEQRMAENYSAPICR